MTPGSFLGSELAGYRLEALVSRGGMAMVYLAQDKRLGRKVALKILAEELADDHRFRERFLRESRIAASIDHPNVIPIYEAGEAEGRLYIAMRYVAESDLRRLLDSEGPLEVTRAISIATQIASALEAAHRHDLVHRDVKPGNALLIPRRSPHSADHVYLSDFGVAKSGSDVGLTVTGAIVGTVNYAAPEQLEGGSVDRRSDIYSLGCLLFQCLTGVPPFRKDEPLAVVMAHLRDTPPSVTDLRRDCPPRLAAIVAQALEKDPDQRFQTCGEVSDALQEAAIEAGAQTPITTGLPPPSAGGVARDGVAEGPHATAPPTGPAGVAPAPVGEADGTKPSPGEGAELGRRLRARPGAALPGRARWVLGLLVGAALAAAAVVLVLGGSGEEEEAGPDVGAALAAEWRSLPDAPTPRQQTAGAVVDGRIWLIGGLAGEEATSATTEVDTFDPVTGTWGTGPKLPFPLHHAVARNFNGELVVIGGWIPEGADVTAETSSRVLALRDGEWVRLPDLNHPRAAAGAAVAGGELIVVGGHDDEEVVATTEVFDGERWRDAAPMPTPREHLATATDGRFLYAVGGRNLSSDQNSAALERYDPATDTWKKLPSMSVAAGSLDAAITAGHLVAVGGEAPTEAIDAVQSFDLRAREWAQLPSLPTPRHGLTVVARGDTLYALVGAEAPSHAESTPTVEALDLGAIYAKPPRVEGWRQLASAPTARQQATAAAVDGRVWLLGGLTGRDGTDAMTSAEAYDPTIDNWTAGPELPFAVHHAAAAAYDGELVLAGGWIPEGADLSAETSGTVLALRGEEWVELPGLNHPRAAAAAAAVGDKLILVGGQDDNGELVATTEVFDGESWSDAAEIPTPREHLAAVSDGRYLYAVGGRELSADRNLATLERYDPSADEWVELRPMPVPSGGLGAGLIGTSIVVVGGDGNTEVIDAVQSFDILSGRWAELPSMPTPRHGLGVAAIGNTLYALTGAASPGHVASSTVAEALDFE